MKDNFGDDIKVAVDELGDGNNVHLAVHAGTAFADALLTPAKARKLAKKLRRAADEIDGGQAAPTDALRARDGFQLSGYLLDLTQAEAETLAVILYKVGGPTGVLPGTRASARIHADTIADKLTSLGLDREALAADDRYQTEPFSSIYFQVRA